MPRGQALHVADKRIELQELPAWTERPLSAIYEGLIEEDSLIIVLPGPDRVKVALVERTAAD